jgi:chromosome segregation ATPase
MNKQTHFLGAIMLLASTLQADMLFSILDYQSPVVESVTLDKQESSAITGTVAAATMAGIYYYGKKAGYKEVMRELDVIKGQNRVTHAEIQKILRELNQHGSLLDGIKNKQADHSYDLNRIRQTIERMETKVDTANTKLGQVHDKTIVIEGQVTATNNKVDKLQGTINAQRAGQIRQTQVTHDMLRGLARILDIMNEESRAESRQILTALGERMVKSKVFRLLLR